MPFAESRELQERFRAHRLGKLQRRLCPQVEEEVPVLRQEEEERRVSASRIREWQLITPFQLQL